MTTQDKGHNHPQNSSSPAYIRLSELAAIVGQVLDTRFGRTAYWVLAEVSGHQYKQQKNYHSFELVEKREDADALMAKFSAKAWGAGAAQIQQFERLTGQRFTSNIQVLAKVKVVFHEQYGLALDLIELDAAYTVGKLYEARHLTLQKLVAENDFIEKTTTGYWTRNKSTALPVVLQRLAIISSLTSAGMEDFIHTLEKNPEGYFFEIDKYLTVVQGVNNADQVVDQFIQIFKSGKQYDAVLLLRGGGAQTDFILFDQYQVARAIAKFPVPIITGIGHQKNETLADLMAHTATKTPTQAAEFILHHNRSFESRLVQLRQSVILHSKSYLSEANNTLNRVNGRIVHRTRDFLQLQQRSLYKLQSSLSQAAKTVISQNDLALQRCKHETLSNTNSRITGAKADILRQKEKIKTWSAITLKNADGGLKHQQTSIRLMSPERILQKGFALISKNGKIITDHRGLAPEDTIDIITSQVTLEATIHQKKENKDGTGFNL
ncbi:exodeoxyribonuclease VII large subunit [Arachidicoccus ginsenosidivorans]|nr:exodeoxyribonuclease VII large subunit [Arachidicoccus ginsenosidivorans]